MKTSLNTTELEAALRNSGYDFNSKITDAELIGRVDDGDHDRTEYFIYEISWDVSSAQEPVTFCNTVYISFDQNTNSYFGDI